MIAYYLETIERFGKTFTALHKVKITDYASWRFYNTSSNMILIGVLERGYYHYLDEYKKEAFEMFFSADIPCVYHMEESELLEILLSHSFRE